MAARRRSYLVAAVAALVVAAASVAAQQLTLPSNYHIITPGIFVNFILQGERYEKRIEKRTTRQMK